jgi:hypothetical protein
LDLCVEVDGDDESVKTQDLGEDEDQDHPDEEAGLLSRTPDPRISHDADGEAGRQTAETHGQSGAQVEEAPAPHHNKKHISHHMDDKSVTIY